MSFPADSASEWPSPGPVVNKPAISDVREPGAHPVDPNFCLDSDLLSF
jgi:hypothetical protein